MPKDALVHELPCGLSHGPGGSGRPGGVLDESFSVASITSLQLLEGARSGLDKVLQHPRNHT